MRERDIAAQLGISEAALVAAECGLTAIRIDGDANRFLDRAPRLGEVMALTRNESAVHEKIGVFENITTGKHASIVLGENIDLRIFPSAWAHGFAVTKTDGDDGAPQPAVLRQAGNAVHKVHLRPASNLDAYHEHRRRLPARRPVAGIRRRGRRREHRRRAESSASMSPSCATNGAG